MRFAGAPGCRRLAGAFLALAVLATAGCFDDRGDPPPPLRQIGLHWEQFPDIPFPPGWHPVPGEDRVAIAVAGGSVRRLQLAMQAPAVREDLKPEQAMQRNAAAVLPDEGWARPEGRPDDLEQRWRKGSEILVIRAAREDGLVVMRYRIEAAR